MAKKSKKEVKEKVEKEVKEKKVKGEDEEASAKRVKAGKGGSFNEGSYAWAMYMVLKEAMAKTFELESFAKKIQSFCKDIKIKFKEKRTPLIVRHFCKIGLMKKLEDGEYKNLAG